MMPTSDVNNVFQDRSGAMWFCTDEGVTRWDGITWRTYTRADGLPYFGVTWVFQDASGVFWFGSEGHGSSSRVRIR